MNNLVVILGPTGVGKTELSLQIAEHLAAPILSADSRQIYREIPICSAAATLEQQARVKHYFVGTHALDQGYSAAQFEADAMDVVNANHNLNPNRAIGSRDTSEASLSNPASGNFILCGGSMLYLDAVCKGIDDMPQADPAIRERLNRQMAAEGLTPLLEQLEQLDPVYFASVDKCNPQRIIHGLEMCLTTGRPFSSFRTGVAKVRPFNIIKIGLTRSRDQLYDRITRRVDQMLDQGLVEETRRVYDQYAASLHLQLRDVIRNPGPTQAQPVPNLFPTALNTVGLKEMLLYHEGIYDLSRAVDRIVHNSKIYSKKQMTWFQRDESIHWFSPEDIEGVFSFLSPLVAPA